MKKNMIIFVVGKPTVGKTTLSRALAYEMGMKAGDCSDIVYESLATRLCMTVRELREFDKNYIRQLLVQEGDKLTQGMSDVLAAELYKRGCNVISGVRRVDELMSALNRFEAMRIKCVIVHVLRNGIPAVEDNTEDLSGFADISVELNTLTGSYDSKYSENYEPFSCELSKYINSVAKDLAAKLSGGVG